MAIHATGDIIGTPACIKERVLQQTAAIELDQLQVIVSETTLIIYGKSISFGKTASNAFSASFPCHMSLLDTHLSILTSHTENGGKL
jgi:hypothetical protein